jgi:hypothetical protein
MDTWLNPANLPRLGDLLAIPFFLLLAAYFASKGLRRLTPLEFILFLFAVTGFIADIYFVSHINKYSEGFSNTLPQKEGSLCFYTCFFGPSTSVANKIPPIPSENHDCYYFSNNRDTLKQLEGTKWKSVYVNTPIKPSDKENAMDAKELKACPHRFKELLDYEYACYYDSKRKVRLDTVENALTKMKETGAIMAVTRHPFIHNSVWDEFDAAMGQPRYAEDRRVYKNYIEGMLEDNPNLKAVSDRHFETSTIIRKMGEKAAEIGNRWYKDILKTGPECQISFSFIQQMYKDYIIPI